MNRCLGHSCLLGTKLCENLLPPADGWPKDNDRTRKRCRVTRCAEFESAAQVTNLAPHGIFVPPTRICPGRDQADDQRAGQRGFKCLTHPRSNLPAVGRIHPASPRPRLLESVVIWRKESSALRILRSRSTRRAQIRTPRSDRQTETAEWPNHSAST